MRLSEISSQLNKYLVTVKVHGTSVKTLIHSESQSQARLLLGKMFGKDNVQSINSISTNESQTTLSLNLLEAVNADDLVSLWQIVSQNVFLAVEKERREAEEAQRLEASKPKRSRALRSPSRSVTLRKSLRPKAVKPQVAKPQASKTQPTALQSVAKQQTPKMTQATRPQMQTHQQTRTTSVQPTRRTPLVAQPINQQQQIAQVNRKLY